MKQERVAEVLSIERQALEVHRDAEERAEEILDKARDDAAQLRDQTMEAARQEAGEIVERAREDAQAERQRILVEAEQKASELQASVEPNHDRAVRFVVDQVAGQE